MKFGQGDFGRRGGRELSGTEKKCCRWQAARNQSPPGWQAPVEINGKLSCGSLRQSLDDLRGQHIGSAKINRRGRAGECPKNCQRWK
jgi:hypothetical protein